MDQPPSHDRSPLGRIEQLELEIAELNSELERSHRLVLLGTIASSIAHEFNNILTPVLSYGHYALDRPNDHSLLIKALRRAVNGTERAARISQAILEFAGRQPASGPRMQPTACIADAIFEAMNCLARPLEQDGITLDITCPPDTAVQMDSVSLQQVLLNLILNARSAMTPGGGVLTIQTNTNQNQGVGLVVRDTGRGMTNEAAASLLRPFAAAGPPGHGLGLMICRRLVEQAHGTIRAESSPGQGTTFIIELPAASVMPLQRSA